MKNIIIYGRNAFEYQVKQPISCTVHGELNGDLSAELTISNDEIQLNLENIMEVNMPLLGFQQFRLKSKQSTFRGIKYKAPHVFYDLFDNYIIDKRPTTATPREALESFLEGLSYSDSFSIGEVFTGSTNTAYWMYINPVDALIGTQDNSFINRWGGEIKRDNFQINFLSRIARQFDFDGDIEIPHVYVGRDITDLNLVVSIENVVTRIIPTALNSDNSIVRLPETYVDSTHINDYQQPKIKRFHYSDIKQGTDEYPEGIEGAQAMYAEMRRRAQAEFAKGIDLPQVTGTISLIDLASTEEFKGIEGILPYDDFIVVDKSGGQYSARMTAFDYDCLSEKYINLTIGNVNTMQNFEKLIRAIK